MMEMREHGAKYAVLCQQLGLPGDNRAEHGCRNRGDSQDFSPLLLEKYLSAAFEIVNAPELPGLSRVFADLMGAKQAAPSGSPKKAAALVSAFALDREVFPAGKGSSIALADFWRRVTSAHVNGVGGVLDLPKAVANQTIPGKGRVLTAAFGGRTWSINPNADL